MNKITITTSFDRTVYPLDSLMHIRVRLHKLIENKLIKLEIYNKKNRLLAYKTINPQKAKSLDETGYLFQTNIRMKGYEWKIGNIYTLKTRYGKSAATNSMTIEQRKPIIQTDKSVYIIGSDIIVTVIAPDLDKDNDKPETIGNKPDHCLTISSSCGSIKNYKLVETGDSTGIFQGVIGLLPRYVGSGKKKKLNKTRGTGPINGYLPVRIGDEITFQFKSESGNVKLVAFSSNFGVTVEMDQKRYCPTDKVYLTVVAPDFNFNSDKVNTIGNIPECKLTISTNEGKLPNYKLVETGKDTGIFTGEVSLTGTKNIYPKYKSKRFGKTFGKGPVNGKLACSSDDIITVKVTTDDYVVQGKAQIKFNIGKINWDSDGYTKGSVAKIRVIDPDMNFDPNKRDFFNVKVWSDSDLRGLAIKVIETNEATGIFEGSLILGQTTIPSQKRLRVKEGDSIFVKYDEWTLPKELHYNRSFEIVAHSKIQEKRKTTNIIKILKDSAIPHEGKYLDHEDITIRVGEKVRWINDDTAAHTVTSGTAAKGSDGNFDSSMFMTGGIFESTFNQKGTYDYFDMVHPWITGKIIVK